MNTIKITCKCGEEIAINPASLLGKMRKRKYSKEHMKELARKRHSKTTPQQ